MVALAMKNVTANDSFEEIKVELESGNTAFIRAFNPHGFYRISLAKGNLPEHLKGNYTHPKLAETDLRAYLASKGRDTKAA